MLMILSPAKTMDFETRSPTRRRSTPACLDKAAELVEVLREFSEAELARRMKLSPDRIAQVVDKIGPMLRRIERLARHRYWIEPERLVLPILGWYCFIMATIVAIPFPLSNLIPGISVALVGIAISTRDGLWLGAALVTGLIGLIVLAVVYGAALFAVLQFF